MITMNKLELQLEHMRPNKTFDFFTTDKRKLQVKQDKLTFKKQSKQVHMKQGNLVLKKYIILQGL